MIIVLRNGYGSTERLEENLQAILFDAEPRMPSRSLKDLAARSCRTPEEWVFSHRIMWAILLVILMGMIWMAVRRRRNYPFGSASSRQT